MRFKRKQDPPGSELVCPGCRKKIRRYSRKEAFAEMGDRYFEGPRRKQPTKEEKQDRFEKWANDNLNDCPDCEKLSDAYLDRFREDMKKKMAELGLKEWS